MIVERLEVKRFRRVRDVDLALGDGLNVVFGPNDLGKSTLAEAIRAALLMRSTAKEAERFIPWAADDDEEPSPMVRLTFRDRHGNRWRVRKRFGRRGGAGALLEREVDGAFEASAKGRQVDGTLRELLRLGVPAPGGRGGPRGIPDTFLARALLGEQGEATALFEQGVDDDPSASGREWLEETVAAYARDETFDAVLEHARAEVARAYSDKGKRSGAAGTPFREAADRIERAEAEERGARQALDDAEATAASLRSTGTALKEAEAKALEAATLVRLAEAHAHRQRLAALDEGVTEAEATLAERTKRAEATAAAAEKHAAARERLAEREREATALERRLARARASHARAALEEAELAVAEATKAQRGAAAQARLFAAATLLVEERGLQKKLKEARDQRSEAEDLSSTAATKTAEAESLEAEAGPDLDALRRCEEASRAHEVARARLSVGLRLRLELADDVEAEVTRDDRATERAEEATIEADARATIVLRRGGAFLARVDASAGDEALHHQAEEARSALDEALAPLLEVHGAEGLDDLRRLAKEAALRRERATERRAEAGRLRERAAEARAKGETSALEERLAAIAEERAVIADRAEAAALLEGDGSVDERAAAADRALATAETALREAIDRRSRAEAALEACVAALDEDLGSVADPAEEDPADLAERLRELRTTLSDAREALPPAAEDAGADELDAARRAVAELRARRAALVESAPANALATAEADEAPPPEEATRLRAEAEAEVVRLREALARLEGRAERQPVSEAKERWERATEVLERARAAEREVELEYEGYRKLVAVLEETAARAGRDLGATLVAPVRESFERLLAAVGGEVERYGGLALTADGATEGAVVDGEVRELGALSMGTREQLATLLRLTLARRLGSFLVLDDHLTHTDAQRARVLGELLRDVATDAQILVFTCHPESYLGPEERPAPGDRQREAPGLRAIDAEAILRDR